jgi:hypothetical protein
VDNTFARSPVFDLAPTASVSDREGRFVWLVQPFGIGSVEADRQVE